MLKIADRIKKGWKSVVGKILFALSFLLFSYNNSTFQNYIGTPIIALGMLFLLWFFGRGAVKAVRKAINSDPELSAIITKNRLRLLFVPLVFVVFIFISLPHGYPEWLKIIFSGAFKMLIAILFVFQAAFGMGRIVGASQERTNDLLKKAD